MVLRPLGGPLIVTTLPFPAPTPAPAGPGVAEAFTIDCDRCALQDSDACGDCVVTFLCGVDASEPVVVDLAEARAMRLLGDAGLAPPSRFSPQPGHPRQPGSHGPPTRTG